MKGNPSRSVSRVLEKKEQLKALESGVADRPERGGLEIFGGEQAVHSRNKTQESVYNGICHTTGDRNVQHDFNDE